MSVAVGLKKVMADRGLDDLDVLNLLKGRRVGVAVSTFYGWKNGHRNPSHESLMALADVLGCSTDELLGREPLPGAYEPPASVVSGDGTLRDERE